MADETSIRTIIMEQLKANISKYAFWDEIEPELAIRCADLDEPISGVTRNNFIEKLLNIREFLSHHKVENNDMKFLADEVEQYKNMKQISLYVENDDTVPDEVVNKFCRLSMGSEGVLGIPQDYNYKQLSYLTNQVFKKTGLIKFYISNEQKLFGKIIAEIYEYPQNIPIAIYAESRKIDKDTGEPLTKHIYLFGEPMSKATHVVVKEIEIPLYVYRFISQGNDEYILFTNEKFEIGDYVITGVAAHCNDYKPVSESAKIPTKLPFIFAHTMRSRMMKFDSKDALKDKLEKLNIPKEKFFEYPFSLEKNNRRYQLLQPTWYKWFIWSWLTHKNVGLFNKYPLHIMQIGVKHSGKSLMLNSLHEKSHETKSVFSGSSSTLKSLVPSFRTDPARIGYLAESNRFAFCDEFLRCMVNTNNGGPSDTRQESVALMNDLLEHQKREAGSGNSRVNVNMTSRIMATTNPIRDIHGVEDLINKYDESFLSRWLVYYQTDEHVNLIRQSKDSDLKQIKISLRTLDWIGILDFLQEQDSTYDMDRVEQIHKKQIPLLSDTLAKHYDARHLHHIECIIDGIIKTRCLMDRDLTFKAKDEDYVILEDIWTNIIKSWIRPEYVKRLPQSDRVRYLPESSQFLYKKISDQMLPLNRRQIKDMVLDDMKFHEFNTAITILIDMGVLLDDGRLIRPYFLGQTVRKQEKIMGDGN